jgi:hypothetical protein
LGAVDTTPQNTGSTHVRYNNFIPELAHTGAGNCSLTAVKQEPPDSDEYENSVIQSVEKESTQLTSSGAMDTQLTSSGAMDTQLTSSGAMVTPITSSGAMDTQLTSSGAMDTQFTSSGAMDTQLTSSGAMDTQLTSSGAMFHPITDSRVGVVKQEPPDSSEYVTSVIKSGDTIQIKFTRLESSCPITDTGVVKPEPPDSCEYENSVSECGETTQTQLVASGATSHPITDNSIGDVKQESLDRVGCEKSLTHSVDPTDRTVPHHQSSPVTSGASSSLPVLSTNTVTSVPPSVIQGIPAPTINSDVVKWEPPGSGEHENLVAKCGDITQTQLVASSATSRPISDTNASVMKPEPPDRVGCEESLTHSVDPTDRTVPHHQSSPVTSGASSSLPIVSTNSVTSAPPSVIQGIPATNTAPLNTLGLLPQAVLMPVKFIQAPCLGALKPIVIGSPTLSPLVAGIGSTIQKPQFLQFSPLLGSNVLAVPSQLISNPTLTALRPLLNLGTSASNTPSVSQSPTVAGQQNQALLTPGLNTRPSLNPTVAGQLKQRLATPVNRKKTGRQRKKLATPGQNTCPPVTSTTSGNSLPPGLNSCTIGRCIFCCK